MWTCPMPLSCALTNGKGGKHDVLHISHVGSQRLSCVGRRGWPGPWGAPSGWPFAPRVVDSCVCLSFRVLRSFWCWSASGQAQGTQVQPGAWGDQVHLVLQLSHHRRVSGFLVYSPEYPCAPHGTQSWGDASPWPAVGGEAHPCTTHLEPQWECLGTGGWVLQSVWAGPEDEWVGHGLGLGLVPRWVGLEPVWAGPGALCPVRPNLK